MKPLAKGYPIEPSAKQEALELCGMLSDMACKLSGRALEDLRDDLRMIVMVSTPEAENALTDDAVRKILSAVFPEENDE